MSTEATLHLKLTLTLRGAEKIHLTALVHRSFGVGVKTQGREGTQRESVSMGVQP